MNKLFTYIFCLLPIIGLGQSTDQNFVKTTIYRTAIDEGQTSSNVIESISYVDGLGRTLQTRALNAGGDGQDHVTPYTYDFVGRKNKQYLPFVDPNQSASSFDYTDNQTVVNDLGSYYRNTKYPDDFESPLNGDAFAETYFEASPLNRPLRQGAPGSDWNVNLFIDDHTVKYVYGTNSQQDEVMNFDVTFTNDNPKKPNLVYNYFYPDNELMKNIVKDEDWTPALGKLRTTETYTDKTGALILKRSYAAVTSGGFTETIAHDTYYVYDSFGNTSYVISPKGTDAIADNNIGYIDFTQNIVFEDLVSIADANNGSGGVVVTMNNGTLSVHFNMNFTAETTLRLGAIMQLSHSVSDIELGQINIGDKIYTVAIESEFLTLEEATLGGTIAAGTQVNTTIQGIPVVEIPNNVLNKLGYRYRYDYRNRLIRKRQAGKQWEEIVYDKLDRPVLTQDPNLKARGKWLFTKFDDLGRVVYTGFYTTTQTRNQLQNILDVTKVVNEERIVIPSSTGGKNMYYSNKMFPTDNTSLEVLTVNYYDNYNWNAPLNPADDGITTVFDQTITDLTQGITTGNEVKVLDTNSWIRTATWYDDKGRVIYNTLQNNYLAISELVLFEYDFIGNITKTETRHTKRDVVCSDTGGIFPVCIDHFQYITTTDDYTYDHQNRLLTHVQTQKDQDNNSIGSPELIASNSYDELGLLVQKDVGGAPTNTAPLQKVDYAHNVRGWLKQVNDPTNTLSNDVFACAINYNTITLNNSGGSKLNTEVRYNGNISEVYSRTASDDVMWAYGYQYDALDRLEKARYKAGDNLNENNKFYDLSNVNYDKNGNITRLRRRAPIADFSDHEKVDKLNYKYFNNSNQLRRVNDNYNGTITDGFVDGGNTDNDYAYDDNGNLIFDKNKNITKITYNFLNLPTVVIFSETGETNPTVNYKRIVYTYDATGVKVEKRTEDIGIIANGAITAYCTNFVYERQITAGIEEDISVLQFFNHPEGYVEPVYDVSPPSTPTAFNYIYQYKDHLGNIRASYSDYDGDGHIDIVRNGVDIDGDNGNPDYENEIVQAKDYYPFGLEHRKAQNIINGRNHEWAFANKEFNEEFGINWHDFGARNYQADLGRWMNLDAYAESFYDYSPYMYAMNNPIMFVDPDGNFTTRAQSLGDVDDWVPGSDGEAITYSEDANGNLTLSDNATADTQQIVAGINESGSKTAKSQFKGVADSEGKVNLVVNKTDTGANGKGLNGLHQPHDANGNALNWDSNTNSFDGEVDTFVDSNGNTAYTEATITIFETNFNDDSQNKFGVLRRFGIWDGGLTKSNTMTGTFAHEVFHNLDQKTISTVKQNSAAGKKVNSYDVETPAYKVQGQVHQEIKSNRKKN